VEPLDAKAEAGSVLVGRPETIKPLLFGERRVFATLTAATGATDTITAYDNAAVIETDEEWIAFFTSGRLSVSDESEGDDR
jgi:hypothetical protein